MCPNPFFAFRTVTAVVRHDLRFDLGFDISEELLHFLQINVGQLLLNHEPRDWVEVVADHLHSEARAFHQGGPAAHKNVRNFELVECPLFLMVRVIAVPDQLCGM